MNPCIDMQEHLKAYLDGQLPFGLLRLRVRLHLSRCALCQEEVAAMRVLSREMQERGTGGFDPGLKARILESIPEGPPPVPAASGNLTFQREGRRPFVYYISGAAVVGALAGLLFLPSLQKRDMGLSAGVEASKSMPLSAPAGSKEAVPTVPAGSTREDQAKNAAKTVAPVLRSAPASASPAEGAESKLNYSVQIQQKPENQKDVTRSVVPGKSVRDALSPFETRQRAFSGSFGSAAGSSQQRSGSGSSSGGSQKGTASENAPASASSLPPVADDTSKTVAAKARQKEKEKKKRAKAAVSKPGMGSSQ